MTAIDPPWPDALAAALDRAPGAARAAVLVAVTEARGSTPREVGAAMVVTADGSVGTIGGGHLEFEATRLAREALEPGFAGAGNDNAASDGVATEGVATGGGVTPTWLVRFPLAARLGQCCGGVATLAFHVVGTADATWVAAARDAHRRGVAFALVACAGSAERRIATAEPFLPAAAQAGPRGADTAADGRPAAGAPLVLVHRPSAFDVGVFGNGHVGRALVRVLAALPARVRWIDSREHDFPAEVPANVEIVATDAPEAELAALPAGSYVVVLTHSHALDFDIVEAALARDDWAYVGLIGSASKRAQFGRRLAARGRAPGAIARVICPIGAPAGLTGKEPGVIAVAVAAELLARREARARDGVLPTRSGDAADAAGRRGGGTAPGRCA
jgi:xanthine dehydrogenase accessory factor